MKFFILLLYPSLVGMNTINIVKDGIIFENLGKMDLKTASHDLIITFDIKNLYLHLKL